MSRLRNWVFTLNNYTEDEYDYLTNVVDMQWSYIVFGKETGENGTPHLQGYVEFDEALTMGQVKKRLGCDRFHLEQRRGTQEQAVTYCKKDGEVFEAGEAKMGARPKGEHTGKNQAMNFMDMIKDGKLSEIANHPDCSFNTFKFCQTIAPLMEAQRDVNTPMNVRWYWGPTGTGKTRRAWYEAHKLGLGPVYIKSTNSKWFDGYDGQKVIVFDDLRSSWFEYSYLLKLLDRYPTQVECKGGSRQWQATHVYVTCPFHPKDMYKSMQERDLEYDSIEQLKRRIDVICEMPGGTFGQSWTEPEEASV